MKTKTLQEAAADLCAAIEQLPASEQQTEVSLQAARLSGRLSPSTDKPSVGRIVHFVNETGVHHAAMITMVWSSTCVNLCVFPTTGAAPTGFTSVLYAENPPTDRRHSWHWPERE